MIKYGEIALKGENRVAFERLLESNIKLQLRGFGIGIRRYPGRMYVTHQNPDERAVSNKLSQTFGIVSFSPTIKCEKDIQVLEELSTSLVHQSIQSGMGTQYKIEARRTDKSFPLNSYEIACRLGDYLKAKIPALKVKVRNPDWILYIEIREFAYIYGIKNKGPGGLPLGSSGKGLLLLSGGIDSPVAGYLMGKRGLELEAVYFHTHPFTSHQAREKVEKLTEILSAYFPRICLHIIPFTDAQTAIKKYADDSLTTLLMRACMVRIADVIAKKRSALCLVTGESLGQVASQTPESMRFTGSFTDLPVFRPLIGMDKEEIISLARRLGTYETSILPYPDCCTLFSPSHPVIKPHFMDLLEVYNKLEIEDILGEAAENSVIFHTDGH